MDKITLVWRTDVHLADQSPQMRTDDWAATVLGKLEQVGEIARKVGANAVIDGGDFFHIKSPSRTTHALLQKVAAIHQAYPCPVYALTGNHDVKYSDKAYLDEAPLGVLFTTGVFQLLGPRGHTFNSFHRPLTGGIPGCVEVNLTVRVVGVSYHGREYDQNLLTTIVKGSEDYLVVAAHLLASQAGGEMFGGEDIVKYNDIVNLDPDMWCFGHWHKDQGIAQINGKHIVNIGSLTRGSLSQDDMTRIPAVAILRFTREGVTVERRELDVQPVSEVFDIEGKVRAEARSMTVDAFVDSVKETLGSKDKEPLMDTVRALDIPEPVKERVLSMLEEQGAT